MKSSGQVLSPTSQVEAKLALTADRPVVGYTNDYPNGVSASWHSHPLAQLIYAVSGVMHVETEAAGFIIPPTSALIVPIDLEHAIYMDGPVKMRTLFLKPSTENGICDICRVIAVKPLLRELILAACSELLDRDLDRRGHHIVALAMDEIARAAVLPLSLPLPTDVRLRRVADALRKEPSNTNSLSDWAQMANASERTLARLFRKETGLSFRQWRQCLRLTAAMNALSLGKDLAKAAAVAGFESQSAFGAAFRSFFGMTPGQARAMMDTSLSP